MPKWLHHRGIAKTLCLQLSKKEMENIGSTASLIVGWIRVNRAGVPEFRCLSLPTPVQPLGTASLSIDPTPPSWKVGVWTSYGNVFWV
ncbi:MAG: hypothetical protein RMJ15_08955 [Nitrososphaerota archaeon]|nr:hypothetical protein [Nitrososphaerota archaeon]